MGSSRNAKRRALAGVVLLLLLGAFSFRLIPFERIWSFDLQCSWAYHHSELGKDHPYDVPGNVAGDVIGRGMAYPPLLYYSFAWLRLFAFREACWVWCVFKIACLLAVPVLWYSGAGRRDKALTAMFWGLLLLQFPSLFEFERGGTDVIVLLLWSLSYFFYARGRITLSGIGAGTAVAYKVYPLFACGVVFLSLLAYDWRKGVRFLAGAAIAGAGWLLLFWSDSFTYVTRVLPAYGRNGRALALFSHHWRMLDPDSPATYVLCAFIAGAWILASYRQFSLRPEFSFAGALAISTFFALGSYDYNLVTLYPLLLVMFWHAQDALEFSKIEWGLLAFTCLSFETSRLIFARISYGPVYHVVLELLAILAIAFRAIRSEPHGTGQGRLEARHL